jgi:hypothetical protein
MEKPRLIKDLGMMYFSKESKHPNHYGLFECECGVVFKSQIRGVNTGRTISCGCYRRILSKERFTKHNGKGTRIYKTWNNITSRCYNPNVINYSYYGGRGITVCDKWRYSFPAFREWALNNGYSDDLEIDRKDNSLGYTPENSWWTTHPKNAQNTRLIWSTNTSGYRGVVRERNKWGAQIDHNGTHHRIGVFNTKEEAAMAYNNYVTDNQTFHPLNIIPNEHYQTLP